MICGDIDSELASRLEQRERLRDGTKSSKVAASGACGEIGLGLDGTAADGGVHVVNDSRMRKGRDTRLESARRKSGDADRWFDIELNRIYNDVINEPLPPDLLELVAKLKARAPEK